MLTVKGIFIEVHVSYLLVGHTHDDINASFGRLSMNLCERDHTTISSPWNRIWIWKRFQLFRTWSRNFQTGRPLLVIIFPMITTNSLGTQGPTVQSLCPRWWMACYAVQSAQHARGVVAQRWYMDVEIHSKRGAISPIRGPFSCTISRYDQAWGCSCGSARVYWLLAINMWP